MPRAAGQNEPIADYGEFRGTAKPGGFAELNFRWISAFAGMTQK
jgi:hypothetical protein